MGWVLTGRYNRILVFRGERKLFQAENITNKGVKGLIVRYTVAQAFQYTDLSWPRMKADCGGLLISGPRLMTLSQRQPVRILNGVKAG